MTKTSIFLFLLAPIMTFSQRSLEQKIVPDPFFEISTEDFNNYQDVKSITVIMKNRSRNFTTDTTKVTSYNNQGLVEQVIKYSKGKEYSIRKNTYNEDGLLLNRQQTDHDGQRSDIFYIYNDNQQLLSFRNISTFKYSNKIDTNIREISYLYEQSDLVEIHRKTKNKPVITKYNYSKDGLKERVGQLSLLVFDYNESGNISMAKEYRGKEIDPLKFMTETKLVYDSLNRVICDSFIDRSNFKNKKYRTIEYQYNSNGQLSRMEERFGENFRIIHYSYLDNRIVRIDVKTNKTRSGYLEYRFPSDITHYYNLPFDYKELYDYDSRGNRIAWRVYVNNELYHESLYIFDYQD